MTVIAILFAMLIVALALAVLAFAHDYFDDK